MRKIWVALLVALVVGIAAATAHQFGMAKGPMEINDTNFEEVKAKILSNIEERIKELQGLKEDVENANSADELKSVMDEHALNRAKDDLVRKIDMAIERIENDGGDSNTIDELEAIKEKVSSATSMDELREIMKDLRGVMEEAGLPSPAEKPHCGRPAGIAGKPPADGENLKE